MAKCVRCGKRMPPFRLTSDGLCESCAKAAAEESRKKRLQNIRAENYQHFLAHETDHKSQRIFDAFIKKYPDALITGVSVKDDGKKLLFYLDGNPMYYATFNPLTNDVDLVKYADAINQAEAADAAAAKQKADETAQASREKNAGCSIWLSVVGILYGVFCLLFSSLGGLIGIVCSLIVLAGGVSKIKGVVILGGALSFAAAVVGFPFSLGYVLFGIFYLCVGSEM